MRFQGLFRILGITLLLLAVCAVTMAINPSAAKVSNLNNVMHWTALFGILALGAAFVIITGGIDLSIGSVVALTGIVLAITLTFSYVPTDQQVTLTEYDVAGGKIVLDGLPPGMSINDQIAFPDRTNRAPESRRSLQLDPERTDLSDGSGTVYAKANIGWIHPTVILTEVVPAERRLVFQRLPLGITASDQIEFAVQSPDGEVVQRRVRIDSIDPNEETLIGEPTTIYVQDDAGWLAELELGGDATLIPAGPGTVMQAKAWNVWLAVPFVLLLAAGIGLIHGLLITKVNMQPFIVTLCGLLIYRGLSRYLAEDATQNLTDAPEGLKALDSSDPFSVPIPLVNWIGEGRWSRFAVDSDGQQRMNEAGQAMIGGDGQVVVDAAGETVKNAADVVASPVALDFIGWVPVPMPMLILLGLGVIAALFLHRTIWGRYLFALGRNEEATRFSGINTDRMVILAYVLCSVLAGLGGILIGLNINALQPAGHGNFYELYAIAAAVLGGCSLRGGVGSVAGVIIGTAVLRTLYNSIVMLEIPTYFEYTIIGGVLLIGVMADEVVRKAIAAVRARNRRAQAAG